MFDIKTGWRVEKYLTMLRITAEYKNDNDYLAEQVVKPLLIEKILELIDASIKFKGKLIGDFPVELQKNANTMYVYVCMIFETDDLVENFKKEIPRVLKQG